MRAIFHVMLAATLLGLAAPAAAQSRDQNWERCVNRSGAFSQDVEFAGCTALIQSGAESSVNLAVAYYNRGNGRLRQGNYAAAIADHNEAIRLNPRYADAFANRGVAYSGQNDPARALADFNEAIRLDPQQGHARFNRGNIWFDRRDYTRAIADYDETIRLGVRDFGSYFNRGLAHERAGNAARALADYREAARLSPGEAAVRASICRLAPAEAGCAPPAPPPDPPGARCSRVGAPPEWAGNRAATIRSFTVTPAGGSSYTIQVDAADPDGDALLYTYSSTGGRVAADGPRGTWTLSDPGTYSLMVEINDRRGCVTFGSATATR